MKGDDLRLVIVVPDRNVVTESFIKAHLDGLSSRVLAIWGSPRPLFSGDSASILSGVPASGARLLGAVTGFDATRSVSAVGRRLPSPWYERQLASFLCSAQADAVLAEYGPTGVVVMDACRRARTPLVVHFHGYDAYHLHTLERHREAYRRLFAVADRMVAVSRHMLEQLKGLGAPIDRLVYNTYGVDTEALVGADPASVGPVFLALGRFVEKKAPTLTLRAFAAVHREEPRARLVMLGDGPLYGRCLELARELGVDGVVDLPGAIGHAEVVAWMRRARCFVQHSLRAPDGDSEGTPLAILEASSCGLPVVATRHAGIVDAVREGTGGFLVDEGDIEGMASHMLRLAREPALAAKMGAEGRRHIVSNYSSEKSLGRLHDVLADVARR